mmetsp:Transcript_19385/g.55791  ORF Transcript_19385/g.55791 Transcript_19385/m.55791 type:complete len:149 (+) Transcript_19385:115-561(+)|eukprot:CAMPEP_0181046718 /NCGR_PEP_ID=MMETSP1070-20121207/14494_1 /TAXON_ID=265543 /ORGANISM="Minutocellus polymorphus, Strain NH13" /LENGTH=148 /DNA_ID=CAMNT_0023125339 /DNA_START=50 /DNA_END=496 /DNA_ORIENTATION=+
MNMKRVRWFTDALLKKTQKYKPCSGAVLEISPSGYVRYIEMDGAFAMNVYSGPITNWDGPDGVWTGCCAGSCKCCPKGCVHFDVAIPPVTTLDTIHVNGRDFKKRNKVPHVLSKEREEEIPIATVIPIPTKDSGLGSGLGSDVNALAS